MKKLIFFICFFIQFYFVYCESYVEIINKAKELKSSILEEPLFPDFSNEYDFLVYKYTPMEEIKKNNDVIIKKKVDDLKNLFVKPFMKEIPVKNINMLSTEVTQELYKAVMGKNPSEFVGDQLPVECVSWYDAIYFCNLLSEIFLLTPVYSVNGETDVTKWNYVPHKENVLAGKIEQNLNANGYRLPTVEEWQYAARGRQNFKYAGSNNIDEVAWYRGNSNDKKHEVGKKKANGYGLFDMCGNVWERCWDSNGYNSRYNCGGDWRLDAIICRVDCGISHNAMIQLNNIGFRIVCSQE